MATAFFESDELLSYRCILVSSVLLLVAGSTYLFEQLYLLNDKSHSMSFGHS